MCKGRKQLRVHGLRHTLCIAVGPSRRQSRTPMRIYVVLNLMAPLPRSTTFQTAAVDRAWAPLAPSQRSCVAIDAPPDQAFNDLTSIDILVARAGIEPATFRFSGGRSYQLSYLARKAPITCLAFMGDPDGTRTRDLRRDRAAR